MKKNLIIIIAGAIAVILVLAGIYFIFLKSRAAPSPPPARQTPRPTASLPQAGGANLNQLSAGWIASTGLNLEGNRVRFFDKISGLLQEMLFSGGNAINLSSSKFNNVYSILWSPAGNAGIIEYIDDTGAAAKTGFDWVSSTQKPLDANIRSVAWSPDGKKIVYHYRNDATGSGYIATAKPDGSDRKIVLSTRLPAVKLFWPTSREVLVLEKPAPQIPNLLLKIDVVSGGVMKLSDQLVGLDILPSSKNKKMLISYSRTGGNFEGFATNLVDYSKEIAVGAEDPSTALPFVTLVDKCTWAADGETLYCAVPDPTIATTGNLPFAFWQGKISTADKIVRYNYVKKEYNEKTSVLNIDVVSPVIARQENYLAFINRLDGGLYSLKF